LKPDNSSGVSGSGVIEVERAAAEAFASDVRGSIENQRQADVENVSLIVDEVSAES
jgi:hypothetical protein